MSAKKAEQTPDELVAAAVGRTPAKAPKAKKAEKAESKSIRIRQVRSGIGCPVEMRETLRALGLGKMHKVSERKDTKEIRGMIKKITHLVEVVE